ncbi:hypothetical protein MKY06_30140 [Priestia sp. FSL P4-0332]|uniref:hypothetical protein n=1 Tax=Priestia sp. FSL P4-0332 TaxID=2921634 RepID=UPI0030F5EACB
MKFSVFTFQELRYKTIAYLLAFIITIVSIIAYLKLPKGADTSLASYVLSIVYALTLFVVGLYINNMSSKQQNMFLKRKGQYKSLHQLLEFYEIKAFKENEDEMFKYVIFSQSFMKRTKGKGNSLISFKGYEQTKKYLKIEEDFLSKTKEIHDLLNKELKNYVAAKKLKMKVKFLFVADKAAFFNDTKKWAEEHLELSDEEEAEFIHFVNNLPNEQKRVFRKMEKLSNRLKNERDKSHKKCKKNIQKIEEIYGDLLFESLEEEKGLNTNFLIIEQLIQELKEELLTESYFESTLESSFDKVEDILNRMDDRLQYVKEEVEDINLHLYDEV